MNDTIPSLLAAAIGHDPTRPLLTWYDDATGDRTELSGATLDNWVAKTANLLVDGVGLGHADTVAVLVPPHWQSAAVLLGCWSAGVAVDHGPDPRPVEALFVAATGIEDAARAWSAGERYVLGLRPLGAPMRELPVGYLDYVVEVRGQGDRFVASAPVGSNDLAVAGPSELSHGELCERAVERAAELDITTGSRVLVNAAHHADPLDWLLAPLAMGATVVLCGQLDHATIADRVAAEKVTVTLP